MAIFAQLGLCLAIVATLKDANLSGWNVWLVKAPLFLFAGWISAAAFVGLPAVLRFHRLEMPDPTGLPLALGLSLAIFVLALAVTLSGAGWLYAAPVVWAFVAVMAANLSGGLATLAFAAGGFAAVLAAVAAYRAFGE